MFARQTFQNFSTLQLRELFEIRGLEFPGYLDKPSMIKRLEAFDALHGEEEKDPAPYPATKKYLRAQTLAPSQW